MKVPTTPLRRRVLPAAGAVLAGLLAAAACRAQVASSPPQIAVIDVQRLLGESQAGKQALDRLRALGQERQTQIEAKQTELNDLRQRLEEGQLSLSEERQAEMEKELQTKLIELRRLQDDAERELQQQRLEAFEGIEERVIPLIAEVAKERGYTLVFNKFQSGLLFAVEEIDITDVVLERFNAAGAAAGASPGS